MDNQKIAGFFMEGWYVFDNFAPFQVKWRGNLYPTSEHAYQAAHFIETDESMASQIRQATSPREAADIANAHSNQEDPNWKNKRLSLMEEIIRCKLEQHEFVRQTLLKTGDRDIVEMNDEDEFWGWGKNHDGQNNLGKIWMKLRSEIIK